MCRERDKCQGGWHVPVISSMRILVRWRRVCQLDVVVGSGNPQLMVAGSLATGRVDRPAGAAGESGVSVWRSDHARMQRKGERHLRAASAFVAHELHHGSPGPRHMPCSLPACSPQIRAVPCA